jgi:uncharacterized protein
MADTEIQSPCIGVCSMNDSTGFCLGCYRTIEEIQGWWDFSFEKKSDVIKKTLVRQEAAFD